MLNPASTGKRESYWSLLLAALRYPDFRLLWYASFAEHFGEFMEVVAILWLVESLTDSPLMLTVVGAIRFTALMFVPILAGALCDRLSRRNLLVYSLIGLTALSIILAALTLAGVVDVWQIIIINFLCGVATSFNHPARQSMIPNLVRTEHLLNAISIDIISVQASLLVSLSMVGYLISSLGVGPIFILRAVGCLLAIVLVLFVKLAPILPPVLNKSIWPSISEGLSYLRANPILIVMIALFLLPMLVANTSSNFIPIYANSILKVGAVGYGYLQAAPGLGGVLIILAITSLTYYKRKATLLAFSGIIMGATLIGLAASSWFYLSILMLALSGAAQLAFNAINTTVIQKVTPDYIRGRVYSLQQIGFGLGPNLSMLFGAVALTTGVPVSTALLGGFCIIISLVVIIFASRFKPVE